MMTNIYSKQQEIKVWCFKVQSTIKNPSLRFQLSFKGKQRLRDRKASIRSSLQLANKSNFGVKIENALLVILVHFETTLKIPPQDATRGAKSWMKRSFYGEAQNKGSSSGGSSIAGRRSRALR